MSGGIEQGVELQPMGVGVSSLDKAAVTQPAQQSASGKRSGSVLQRILEATLAYGTAVDKIMGAQVLCNDLMVKRVEQINNSQRDLAQQISNIPSGGNPQQIRERDAQRRNLEMRIQQLDADKNLVNEGLRSGTTLATTVHSASLTSYNDLKEAMNMFKQIVSRIFAQ